jgi:hypothetical protein
MNQYHKIKTVWKRDPDNNYKTLLEYVWSKPEFELLKDIIWTWTEKVDGTNIRSRYNCPVVTADHQTIMPLDFQGKTDKAQIQPSLLARLPEIFSIEKLRNVFGEDTLNVCCYGEGYGKKIQKAGKDYIPDGVDFILFDVRIGRWWLERHDVEQIAKDLDIKVVPIVGEGTLEEAIEYVKQGNGSTISTISQRMEGLIMFPQTQLFNRKGERIITKLKYKDFAK